MKYTPENPLITLESAEFALANLGIPPSACEIVPITMVYGFYDNTKRQGHLYDLSSQFKSGPIEYSYTYFCYTLTIPNAMSFLRKFAKIQKVFAVTSLRIESHPKHNSYVGKIFATGISLKNDNSKTP